MYSTVSRKKINKKSVAERVLLIVSYMCVSSLKQSP